MRLYLPGVDCIAELVSGKLPKAATGSVANVVPTTTTVAPQVATTTTIAGAPVVAPTTTVFKGPVVSIVDPGTTIAPTDTNPATQVVGVDPYRFYVYNCAKGIPATIKTTPAG
jgi:hypothetical protein